jgi:hypothetical protein
MPSKIFGLKVKRTIKKWHIRGYRKHIWESYDWMEEMAYMDDVGMKWRRIEVN